MRQRRNFGYESSRRERESLRSRAKRAQSLPLLAITVVFALFVAGGLYFGCVFISNVLTWFPLRPPTLPIVGGSDNLPNWRGTERVNILLLGLDQRPDERGQPTRSDTLIVVTIDPNTKSAGMLSIPRDLWVPIPGHGENKINTAHFFGEIDRKGNGPALAKRTVQDLLGVPIHYYVRVDFRGFEQLIDIIGGITLDVEKPLLDNEYPTEDYGVQRIYIPPGIQHLNGRTALQYARSRHGDNDFERTKRQQRVLLAARQQALQLNLLPKLPSMLNTITQSIQTDIPPTDLLALAKLAKEVDSNSIVSAAIDDRMVNDVNGDGTVLTPRRQEIAKVVSEVFSSRRAKQEAAKIEVQNGTARTGLAASVANRLKSAGFNVVKIGNADSEYSQTVMFDYSGKAATVQAIADLLKLSPKNIRTMPRKDTDTDILIILGLDAPGQ